MIRFLPLLILLVVLAGPERGPERGTEYEVAISHLPSEYFEGSCEHGKPEPEGFKEVYDTAVRQYSWSIITADAADRMAAFIGEDSVVDFGAGSGYVSHLLNERDVDITAVDKWDTTWWDKPQKDTWYPITEGNLDQLEGTADKVLLMGWPPRDDTALIALDVWKGDRLIYIGELLRRTASIRFHQEIASNWHLVERIEVPQWYNRSDAIFLFERRTGDGDGREWMMEETSGCHNFKE